MAPKSEFEMCFAIGSQHLLVETGVPTNQPTSRIQYHSTPILCVVGFRPDNVLRYALPTTVRTAAGVSARACVCTCIVDYGTFDLITAHLANCALEKISNAAPPGCQQRCTFSPTTFSPTTFSSAQFSSQPTQHSFDFPWQAAGAHLMLAPSAFMVTTGKQRRWSVLRRVFILLDAVVVRSDSRKVSRMWRKFAQRFQNLCVRKCDESTGCGATLRAFLGGCPPHRLFYFILNPAAANDCGELQDRRTGRR